MATKSSDRGTSTDAKLEDVYSLVEQAFNYCLIMDDDTVLHLSDDLAKETLGDVRTDAAGRKAGELFNSTSAQTLRSTIEKLKRQGGRELVMLETAPGRPSVLLKAVGRKIDSVELFMFWGSRFPELENLTYKADWKRVERAKELACIYSIAEWVEASQSIDEFFTYLPQYLRDGMHYPEHTLVYSVYQGREYGEKPRTERFIKADLVIEGEVRGSICVTYDRDPVEFLPEEQRMLDEIVRMLVLAIERKELREGVDERRAELLRERSKLDKLNSYMEGISRGFEEAKTRLATIFKAIPDKVAIIDRERRVVMTNTDDDVAGQTCHQTFFDSEHPCVDCRLAKIMRQKAPIMLEIQHDGRVFEVHALPIFDQNQEVDGIIEFYRDISEKRNYEQQLQQADKLASLGQLVSGIGHEINNPNQFIRGNVKILRQAMEDMLPLADAYYQEHPDLKIARLDYPFFREHIITLIDDMSNGSERIKGIIEGLKRFARRDEGLLIDDVALNALVRESVRLAHNQVHKTADVELNLADELPEFKGNVQKIEQIFINLIINAGQAMPEERRGLIEIVTEYDGEHVIAHVRDTGVGMSEGTIKQIFDPFFTTKRARGGTGLGLSIVYRIVEEHGGTISVSSGLGEGTTFTLRFPVRRTEAKSSAVLSNNSNGGA